MKAYKSRIYLDWNGGNDVGEARSRNGNGEENIDGFEKDDENEDEYDDDDESGVGDEETDEGGDKETDEGRWR